MPTVTTSDGVRWAVWTERATDPIEAEALFQLRRLAYPALQRLGPVLTNVHPLLITPPGDDERRRAQDLSSLFNQGKVDG